MKDCYKFELYEKKIFFVGYLKNVSQWHGSMREPMHKNGLQKSLGIVKRPCSTCVAILEHFINFFYLVIKQTHAFFYDGSGNIERIGLRFKESLLDHIEVFARTGFIAVNERWSQIENQIDDKWASIFGQKHLLFIFKFNKNKY